MEICHQNGVLTELVEWTDLGVSWDQYDAILLHTIWDYSERVEQFRHWLQNISSSLVNAMPLIEWNIDKRDLTQLKQKGISIPKLVTFETGSQVQAIHLHKHFDDHQLVVKPAIRAGGRRMHLCATPEDAEKLAHIEMPNEPVIVQKYITTIQTFGDFSAIFFNNRLSHVVKEYPKILSFAVSHNTMESCNLFL